MTPAPDQIRFAYAKLVDTVFVWIRNGQVADKTQLGDLADALHNISGILADYGSWIDDTQYRELYLRPYDERWGQSVINLERTLEEFFSQYQAENRAE